MLEHLEFTGPKILRMDLFASSVWETGKQVAIETNLNS